MEWLKLQPRNHMEEDFRPQPFEQLIKVLKNMGHPEDVRELAIEWERRLFKIRRKRGALFSRLHAYFLTATVGWLMGYGYRPFRAIVFMLVTGVFCGAFYDCVKDQAFVPRDSQILVYGEVRDCVHPAPPKKNLDTKREQTPELETGRKPKTWPKCLEENMKEYPRFYPYVYSFNVLFPIVDLFQEKAWVPIRKEVELALPGGWTVRTPGWLTELVVYAELAFGSLVSMLAVALFSGLIRKVHTD